MALIAEAPIDEYYTRTFGPDEIIDLFPISFARMKADLFSFKQLQDPTCSKCAGN